MNQDQKKAAAAQAAIELISDGVIGVGTGSTVNHFIDALSSIRGRIDGAVSSSTASTERLQKIGILRASAEEAPASPGEHRRRAWLP